MVSILALHSVPTVAISDANQLKRYINQLARGTHCLIKGKECSAEDRKAVRNAALGIITLVGVTVGGALLYAKREKIKDWWRKGPDLRQKAFIQQEKEEQTIAESSARGLYFIVLDTENERRDQLKKDIEQLKKWYVCYVSSGVSPSDKEVAELKQAYAYFKLAIEELKIDLNEKTASGMSYYLLGYILAEQFQVLSEKRLKAKRLGEK